MIYISNNRFIYNIIKKEHCLSDSNKVYSKIKLLILHYDPTLFGWQMTSIGFNKNNNQYNLTRWLFNTSDYRSNYSNSFYINYDKTKKLITLLIFSLFMNILKIHYNDNYK